MDTAWKVLIVVSLLLTLFNMVMGVSQSKQLLDVCDLIQSLQKKVYAQASDTSPITITEDGAYNLNNRTIVYGEENE